MTSYLIVIANTIQYLHQSHFTVGNTEIMKHKHTGYTALSSFTCIPLSLLLSLGGCGVIRGNHNYSEKSRLGYITPRVIQTCSCYNALTWPNKAKTVPPAVAHSLVLHGSISGNHNYSEKSRLGYITPQCNTELLVAHSLVPHG